MININFGILKITLKSSKKLLLFDRNFITVFGEVLNILKNTSDIFSGFFSRTRRKISSKNWYFLSISNFLAFKILSIFSLIYLLCSCIFKKVYPVLNLVIPPAVPILILFLPFSLVVIQPDLGTALSIVMLGILILFASGIRIWKFVLGFFVLILSIPLSLNYLQPYQKDRIFSFLNPEADALGRGYQLIQSKIALGSGGLTGKGFLEGSQAYLQYLPEKQTDFIFTLIGEEFGFIGTMFIILLFLLLISVCFYISIKSNHIFGRILSIGVGSNLFIYVIMNISMVSGLMPVVGIPLPLVSYGGSAMLAIITSLGLVLNAELNGNLKKLHYA